MVHLSSKSDALSHVPSGRKWSYSHPCRSENSGLHPSGLWEGVREHRAWTGYLAKDTDQRKEQTKAVGNGGCKSVNAHAAKVPGQFQGPQLTTALLSGYLNLCLA